MGRHSAPEQDDGWHFTSVEVLQGFSVDQVAKVLGVSRSTVGRMSIKGELPYVLMGSGRGHRVYPRRGINAYIDQHTEGGQHTRPTPSHAADDLDSPPARHTGDEPPNGMRHG